MDFDFFAEPDGASPVCLVSEATDDDGEEAFDAVAPSSFDIVTDFRASYRLFP